MPPRFVVDTNVIVSAVLLPRSKARLAFERVSQVGTLLVSAETITEMNDVLRRDDFNKYVSEALRIEFLAALLRDTEFIEITEDIMACRDPRDDKFLSLAISGYADCIISGDKDLHDLHPFRHVQILSPSQFLESNWASLI
ncbi:MAG: putative toxin-antitoxin system toxin component, PIN family [Anaerolineae bacterium]|nr:putative toxin-antitoxin system toxin component, PIN family [Anaerolineae bacterium]